MQDRDISNSTALSGGSGLHDDIDWQRFTEHSGKAQRPMVMAKHSAHASSRRSPGISD